MRTRITTAVKDFYEELPFNRYGRAAEAASLIRAGNAIRASYPAVDALLRQPANRSVLEVGCGTGWFANAAAFHYGARVHAIDLCSSTIAAARAISNELGTASRISYEQIDVFDVVPAALDDGPFRIVNTLGVLHHTYDCRLALQRVLACVAPAGFVHVGLYHLHGRRPFLDLFAGVREQLAATAAPDRRQQLEDQAFALYRELCSQWMTDETLLRSWFRDQALHPHESQHTAEEVSGWLDAEGFECLATSINRYEPVTDWQAVFDEERRLGAVSYQRNVVDRVYYPGFFTLLARRRS